MSIKIYSTIRLIAFLVMKQCGLVDGYGRFEETCRFLLLPRRRLLFTLGFAPAFTLEITERRFLQNIRNYNRTTRRHIPNDSSRHRPGRENLKAWARIVGWGGTK
jgi:hypothetical protein